MALNANNYISANNECFSHIFPAIFEEDLTSRNTYNVLLPYKERFTLSVTKKLEPNNSPRRRQTIEDMPHIGENILIRSRSATFFFIDIRNSHCLILIKSVWYVVNNLYNIIWIQR